jgi:hypothetical protein
MTLGDLFGYQITAGSNYHDGLNRYIDRLHESIKAKFYRIETINRGNNHTDARSQQWVHR